MSVQPAGRESDDPGSLRLRDAGYLLSSWAVLGSLDCSSSVTNPVTGRLSLFPYELLLWSWGFYCSNGCLFTQHWMPCHRLQRELLSFVKLMLLTGMLEKTFESHLDYKDIHPVHPKGDQSWVFIGRTDAEAEPVLWPPHAKSWLIGKDPDAGRDWGQEEKRTTEDEMTGWHHRLDGQEFE